MFSTLLHPHTRNKLTALRLLKLCATLQQVLATNKGGCSLVPRPIPDFISQLWRKIGRRQSLLMSRAGNDWLG